MDRTCIVVADVRYARFFSVEQDDANSGTRLVERLALVNPEVESGGLEAGRVGDRHVGDTGSTEPRPQQLSLEPGRRFRRDIARRAVEMTRDWKTGTVVLVAGPHLLGLTREALRDALEPGVELKELARDYAWLDAARIHDYLAACALIPTRRA
ncbi:MAG TPA: host attachment protein [Burkholderiales bacterium]|nr:host attachment protein [Burkholderiales bacterium]